MRISLVFLLAVGSPILSVLAAEDPSKVSEVISTYNPKESARTPKAIADAGAAFLKALPEKRKKEAALSFDSDEKAKWTNVPPRGEEGGVRLGDLDQEHIRLACDLLHAVMSTQGYEKSRNIMLADDARDSGQRTFGSRFSASRPQRSRGRFSSMGITLL